MNSSVGSLLWPTGLHSNNPLEVFGIWLYLLYILVPSPRTNATVAGKQIASHFLIFARMMCANCPGRRCCGSSGNA